MEQLISHLKRLVSMVYQRFVTWINTASPGSIQVSGVLGLALLVIGYYQLRGQQGGAAAAAGQQPRAAGGQPGQRQQQRGAVNQGSAASTPSSHQAAAPSSAQQRPGYAASPSPSIPKGAPYTSTAPSQLVADTPQARAVHSHLAGVKRLTLSLPGVALAESRPEELQEGASLLPGAASLVKDMASVCDTYLLCHVTDDVSQAAVTGVLEANGVLGNQRGQVPPHRLLFCSTLEGKVSIVRQLEPELHLDNHAATMEELKRFMPQLVHVHPPGTAPAAPSAANVGHTPSLAAFFRL